MGADDGSIEDGRALGGEVGYRVGPGDVGAADGGFEGSKLGSRVGTSDGIGVGEMVWREGATEGSVEGGLVGPKLGLAEGANVGSWEGRNDGDGVDTRVGPSVGTSVGNAVRRYVGRPEGRTVGTAVRPAASGTSDGAGVGLLDVTLTETTETGLASAAGLGVLVSPVEGSAGAIFTTGLLVKLLTSAELVQLKVSRPVAMSATMLSASSAEDSPSSDDRMRTSMETLAACILMIWKRSTGTR